MFDFTTLLLLIISSYTGTVDQVEGDLAHVIFSLDGSEQMSVDLPIVMLPCNVSEGDTIYLNKTEKVTKITCSKPKSSANVEIRVDPKTGNYDYIIKGIQIDLE